MILFHLLRVPQWVKNLLLFAPALFALQLSLPKLMTVATGVIIFS